MQDIITEYEKGKIRKKIVQETIESLSEELRKEEDGLKNLLHKNFSLIDLIGKKAIRYRSKWGYFIDQAESFVLTEKQAETFQYMSADSIISGEEENKNHTELEYEICTIFDNSKKYILFADYDHDDPSWIYEFLYIEL